MTGSYKMCIRDSYLTEHGYTVLSFNLAGYLRTIKDNFQIETQLLEAAKEADMLFIDDLGSEKISDDWGKEKINSLKMCIRDRSYISIKIFLQSFYLIIILL